MQTEKHHKQTTKLQEEFREDVASLSEVIERMGNPYLDVGNDLVTLDTQLVMDKTAIETLRNYEEAGKQHYDSFVQERLVKCEKPLTDIIQKNKFVVFGTTVTKDKGKSQIRLSSSKSNCALFSRMYISCQTRCGDLNAFFAHENHPYPPSLSEMGNLRHYTKSELLGCLHSTEPASDCSKSSPTGDAEVIDGPAVIHMLPPKDAKANLDDYAVLVFMPYIQQHLQSVKRLDVVWDRYLQNSLKQNTRDRRGSGQRILISATTQLPRNWQSFLRENKEDLFKFLADRIESENVPVGKQLVTTYGTNVKCTDKVQDTRKLTPCTHEEADTRLMIHVADCPTQGYKKITVRTSDTDVVVLAVYTFSLLNIANLQLWIAFGTGKLFRYLAVRNIAEKLGPERARALPLFHSFTGCDTFHLSWAEVRRLVGMSGIHLSP